MADPTYIVVTVALKDDDTPERSLVEIMGDICDAGIPGVVSCRAAHDKTPYGWLVPVGTEYVNL